MAAPTCPNFTINYESVVSVIAQAANDDAQLLALVIGLFVIAVLMIGLTIWYWRYTDPKKYIKTRPVQESGEVRNPRASLLPEEPDSRFTPVIDLDTETRLHNGLQRPADIESSGQ